MVREFGMGNLALRTIISCMSALPAGAAPDRCVYVCSWPQEGVPLIAWKKVGAPNIHMALQCIVRAKFRIDSAIAV
eukprot:9496995-Pyramimonas_sp.AAC.1